MPLMSLHLKIPIRSMQFQSHLLKASCIRISENMLIKKRHEQLCIYHFEHERLYRIYKCVNGIIFTGKYKMRYYYRAIYTIMHGK